MKKLATEQFSFENYLSPDDISKRLERASSPHPYLPFAEVFLYNEEEDNYMSEFERKLDALQRLS